jgi:DNA-binding NarL/FixJ family response regulator
MIRLLLVDDQSAVRMGLQMRLDLEPDIAIIGEAADGAAALALALALQPDVVLMDIEMPIMDGLTAAAALRAAVPRAAVVIMSMHDDPATQGRAQASGAAAFVAKHVANEMLPQAIRQAAAH